MKLWIKSGFLYYVAGILLILDYILLWFIDNPTRIVGLWYGGWIIFAIGLVLIFLPMFIFRSKGKVKKGNNWTDTSSLVDTGIYSVIRHPLYLGWLLMYIVIILWNQHWLIVLIGIAGIVSLYLISRQEDQRLIQKFGDDYKYYIQNVPGMNFFAGIIRLLVQDWKK